MIRTIRTQLSRFLVLTAALFALAIPSSAQVVSGTISGTVTDPNGAVIANAKVVVHNDDTGVQRTLVSNSGGTFTAAAVPIGSYTVSVDASGFGSYKRTGITLTVGETLNLNLALKIVGNETVTVQDVPPSVNLSSDQISGLVDARQVKELPLNGRSYDQLLLLNPATVNYTNQRSGSTGTSNSSVGSMFSASGRRPQDNLFLLNGIEYTGASLINTTPGGTSGQLLGIDGIREFNVVTDTYSASYGKRDGAQISISTTGGTNSLHGSVYEFVRNSFFDARNYFDGSRFRSSSATTSARRWAGRSRRTSCFCLGTTRAIARTWASRSRNAGSGRNLTRQGSRQRAAAAEPVAGRERSGDPPEWGQHGHRRVHRHRAAAYSRRLRHHALRLHNRRQRIPSTASTPSTTHRLQSVGRPLLLRQREPARAGAELPGAACLLAAAGERGARRALAVHVLLLRLRSGRGAGAGSECPAGCPHLCGGHLGLDRVERRVVDHHRRGQRGIEQRHYAQPVHLRRPRLLHGGQAHHPGRRVAAAAAVQRQPGAGPIWAGFVRVADDIPGRHDQDVHLRAGDDGTRLAGAVRGCVRRGHLAYHADVRGPHRLPHGDLDGMERIAGPRQRVHLYQRSDQQHAELRPLQRSDHQPCAVSSGAAHRLRMERVWQRAHQPDRRRGPAPHPARRARLPA